MKIKATWRNDLLVFNHVAVKKGSETFYGVYRYDPWLKKTYGEVITGAETFDKASKKAKLIEIGYEMCFKEVL